MDVYTFIQNITSKNMKAESLDLNTVANELLGIGKEDLTWEEMMAGWQSGKLEPLYKYSKRDADITLALSEKLFPLLFELTKLLNISVFDVSRMTTGQIVEWFLLSRAKKEGILAPNRPKRDEQSTRMARTFKGAFVKEPQKGLHKNIAVCDFRSLYPTIIIAHNVGPDTLNCECCEDNKSPSGDWFCKDKPAFLPSVLRDVLTRRFKLKSDLKKLDKKSQEYVLLKSKTNALKLVANSFYGYLGFFGARWYCLECARSVTAWGRNYIKTTMDVAEEQGFTVLYGDTDSLFLSGEKKDFKKSVQEFMKKINVKLPEMMELELEGIFKRGIFLTKKRYAMVDMQGNIVVKGLERVRRDWAPIARKTQGKVLLALLDEGDLKKAQKIVQDAIKRLKNKEAKIEEVEIFTQLTRNLEDYKQMGPHVKAGLRMKKLGKKVRMGTVVRYIITPGLGSISDRARPVEESQNYDPDYYIEHQLVPACQRILDALDIEIESKGQKKLEKFFS
jgi:DNA polymerase Pol2